MSTVLDQATAPIIIGGEARPLDRSRSLEVIDPSSREVVGHAAMAREEDVDEAVRAAKEAFPAWQAMTAAERAQQMRSAADAVAADTGERARLLTREHGKVLWESNVDTEGAARILRYYADLAERYDTPDITEDERGRIVTKRQPFGVVAVIVPWNFPVILGFLMLSPALLAGNTIVVKPPEDVPLAFTETLRVLAASLPGGVVNVVPGVGREAGRALSEHPDVRKISFTGSIPTGRALMRAAATNIKGISLELGGNDPALILEGAHLDDAIVSELIRGVFTSSGQICYNVKRIYVHRSHYHDFVERFTAAADEIVVGNGLDDRSTIGPLTTETQFRFVRELVDRTKASGANVSTVGRKLDPASFDRGFFTLPSVVTGVAPGDEIVTCEQFGPVVPILSFDNEEEAIRLANATDFGLAASVWDDDVDHAFAVADRIEAGTVFVNVHRVGASDLSMPFGGFKQSGFGRGHGYVGVEECSEVKVLAQRLDMSSYVPGEPAPALSDPADAVAPTA